MNPEQMSKTSTRRVSQKKNFQMHFICFGLFSIEHWLTCGLTVNLSKLITNPTESLSLTELTFD